MPIVDLSSIADAMNVTERYVNKLVREGLPRDRRGRYDVEKCLSWYVRHLQDALQSRPVPLAGGKDKTLGSARLRMLTAQAEREEMDLARERSQLVAIRDIELAWTNIIASTKARILAVPARAAPACVGESRNFIAAVIERELKEALTQIVNSGDSGLAAN